MASTPFGERCGFCFPFGDIERALSMFADPKAQEPFYVAALDGQPLPGRSPSLNLEQFLLLSSLSVAVWKFRSSPTSAGDIREIY